MKWKELSTDKVVHKLSIEADWSELASTYNALIQEYRKLSIPGFSPGKGPLALIEKRFNKEIIQHLSQQIAQQFGRQAISESEIKVWGPAEIKMIECKKEEPFYAELHFIPMPKIDLPDLEKLVSNNEVEEDPYDQISLALLNQIKLEVPERLVIDELALDGIDSKPNSIEWESATNRVKLMIVLKEIAQQEGIDIDEKDVTNRIAEKALEFGTSTKKLEQELMSGLGQGLQRLKDMLLAESTLDYLIEIRPK